MEPFTLANDIPVFCVTAESFPDCVLKAHQELHSLIPYSTDRKYFGISYPNKDGNIIYKAAAEELKEGELSKHALEKFIIPRGKYLSNKIENFRQNVPAIGETFQKLIKDPSIDPNGFCLEWYVNDNDCLCLVKTIADENNV